MYHYYYYYYYYYYCTINNNNNNNNNNNVTAATVGNTLLHPLSKHTHCQNLSHLKFHIVSMSVTVKS